MKTILAILVLFLISDSPHAQTGSFHILNPEVHQGDVLIIKINPQWQGPQVGIYVLGNTYFPNNLGEVFIGIGLDQKPAKYQVYRTEYGLRSNDGYNDEIEVIQKTFPTRKRGIFIPTKRWEQERDIIKKAFDGGDFFEKHFNGEFIKPLDHIIIDANRAVGDISSPFGEGHAGVDMITRDPKTGRHERPVKAINSGKVALIAKNFSTDGNMVILDHGSGIFSIYMHLSRFLVTKVGEEVKTGETIALTGNSGNAKRGGPHLHFAVKIKDVYVDPLGFIDIANKYR